MVLSGPELRILPGSRSALELVAPPPSHEPNSGTGQRSMVASMIDAVEAGEIFEGELPAHLTLLPWFRLDDQQWPYFNSSLTEIMEDYRLVSPYSKLQGAAFYGPDNDVEVRKFGLFGTMFIHPVHLSLFALVKRLGASFDETYAGIEHYSPHVTVPTGRTFAEGEHINLDNVTVVQKQDETSRHKLVRAVFKWESRNGQDAS